MCANTIFDYLSCGLKYIYSYSTVNSFIDHKAVGPLESGNGISRWQP